ALAGNLRVPGHDGGKTETAILWALRHIGPVAIKSSLPEIVRAMKEPDGFAASDEAIDTLQTLGPDAVPVLIEFLKDKDEKHRAITWNRDRIAFALGQIGPAARDAVPALTEARQDDN